MPYFANNRPTTRVVLPTDASLWVDIYAQLKWREQRAVAELSSNGVVDGVAAANTLLHLMIAGWNLTDEGGPAAVTPENIDLLDRPDVEAVLEAIQVVAAGEDDESKKSSLSPSSKLSEVPAK